MATQPEAQFFRRRKLPAPQDPGSLFGLGLTAAQARKDHRVFAMDARDCRRDLEPAVLGYQRASLAPRRSAVAGISPTWLGAGPERGPGVVLWARW